jgi:hypothetical protein
MVKPEAASWKASSTRCRAGSGSFRWEFTEIAFYGTGVPVPRRGPKASIPESGSFFPGWRRRLAPRSFTGRRRESSTTRNAPSCTPPSAAEAERSAQWRRHTLEDFFVVPAAAHFAAILVVRRLPCRLAT